MKFSFLDSAPLRIGRGPTSARTQGRETREGGLETLQPEKAEPEESGKEGAPYLSKLVLLVPAEVISLYVALKASATGFLGWFGWICVGLVILVRTKATAIEGKPEWGAVFISTVSFVLWLYSSEGYLEGLPTPKDAGIVAVAIGLWTFVVPYFYQGKPAPKG